MPRLSKIFDERLSSIEENIIYETFLDKKENNMAGHSKWANIKHRKAAQDAQRGKIFTKLIRELVTAAKLAAVM